MFILNFRQRYSIPQVIKTGSHAKTIPEDPGSFYTAKTKFPVIIHPVP
jgi:hypothetical protein